jgi:PAS domain S-box-containing protein
MRWWSLGRGASLALVAAMASLLATGALAARELRQLLEASGWVRHTLEVLVETEALSASLASAESASRGYVLTGQSDYLQPTETGLAAVERQLATLRTLVAADADQRRRFSQLEPAVLQKAAFVRELIELRRSRGEAPAQARVASGPGRELMQVASAALAGFAGHERSLLDARLAARDTQRRQLGLGTLAFAAVGALVLAAAAVALNRSSALAQRAKQALELEAARLHVTLNSCGDALITTDVAGSVGLMNPVAQALTGWREEDARGVPLERVFRIVNEFTREPVENPVSKVLREGKVVGLANHTILIARDGSERPIDDSGAPIRSEDGTVHGVVLVFRDVTARKLSEQSRERLVRAEAEREAALAASRAKDDFLAVLSHELRNPLAGMLGWLEVLRSGALSEAEHGRAIGGIERSAFQQQRLVSDLLDVSRIIAGRLSLERGPLDLHVLVAACVEARRGDAESHRLALAYRGPAGSVIVTGDAERLEQVIGNLLSNAIKFSDPGGRVDVSLETARGRAHVIVQDSGIGIERDKLDQIFDRFWQAAKPRTRRQEGLGLGLAIVRHIVEQHGGSVRAESDGAGRGARFVVELPLESNALSRAREARRGGAGARTGLAGVRLLLVDDEPDGRESLAFLLAGRGAEVREADSAVEAMRTLAGDAIDAVVTDIGMPREDGYSLLAQIRQRDKDRGVHTPVIAVTGFVSGGDRDDALRAGFDEHVGKPVDVALLAERIRAVLRDARPV